MTDIIVCAINTSPRNTQKITHEKFFNSPESSENEAVIEKNIIIIPTNAGIIQKNISFIFFFFTIFIISIV
jgi:hypothetical protein